MDLAVIDFSNIWREIAVLILFGVAGIVALLWKRVCDRIGKWFKTIVFDVFSVSGARFSPQDSLQHRRVQEILQHLLEIFGARRVCLYQYHNGDVYLLGSHIWKTSCTFEVVRPNTTYAAEKNQQLLASTMVDIVEPMLSGDPREYPGVRRLSTCSNCHAVCTMKDRRHWVICHTTASMAMCRYKDLCEQQGIDHSYSVNLWHGENKAGIGYISLQFEKMSDAELKAVEDEIYKLCTAAELAQFLLKDDKDRIHVRSKSDHWLHDLDK